MRVWWILKKKLQNKTLSEKVNGLERGAENSPFCTKFSKFSDGGGFRPYPALPKFTT